MSQENQRIQKKKFDRDDSALVEIKKKMEVENEFVFNLSIEILVKIIGYIPEHRRKNLSLVSKSFYEAVNKVDENRLWIYRCGLKSDTNIEYGEYDPKLVDYEKFISSDNEECPAVRISSINEAVMSFFKERGKKVKQLKFDGIFEIAKYIEILNLVPNCEALCITKLLNNENNVTISTKVPMLKLKFLCFHPSLTFDYHEEKFLKCIDCPNLEELFSCSSDVSFAQRIVSNIYSQIKNLKLKCYDDEEDYENCSNYKVISCISFGNKNITQITSDQITTFERFNTVMSSRRSIKNIKIDFRNSAPAYECEQVLKILNIIGNNLIKVTLRGEIKGNYLKHILKYIKKCKFLFFDDLNSYRILEISERVEFNNLEILKIESWDAFATDYLKLIKLSDNCLKTFICNTDEDFNETLKSQRNIVEFSVYSLKKIEKDLLANCKPKKLSLNYDETRFPHFNQTMISDIDKSIYIDFIKNQIQLEELKVNWVWNEIFKTIAIKCLNLQKLEIDRGNLSYDNFKLISNLEKLKELHLNEIEGDWKERIKECSNKCLEILKLENIEISNICEQLSPAFPNLKKLNLTDIDLNYKEFFENLKQFKNLVSLIVKYSEDKDSFDIRELNSFEVQNELKEFYLDEILFSTAGYTEYFINAFKNVEKLSISISAFFTSLGQLEVILNPFNNFKYVDIFTDIIDFDDNESNNVCSTDDLLFILMNKNLKFLHICGLYVRDKEKFKEIFAEHFEIAYISSEEILLMNNETFDEFKMLENIRNESWMSLVHKSIEYILDEIQT
ncbi:hypothetical protein PVAND_009053 [Polypedilum vanderplanki]|uniref:F-box domain-containing protein n=1 Tax=Polypedilum vanderplanki TaxID=319348 RepID=A0A9J6CCA3_POLVA|nr:hypothetical protein PVAND_009053 [Polypedilum vanderplanki]